MTSDLATVPLPETNSEFTPENRPLGSLEIPELETIIFGGELLISERVFLNSIVYPNPKNPFVRPKGITTTFLFKGWDVSTINPTLGLGLDS